MKINQLKYYSLFALGAISSSCQRGYKSDLDNEIENMFYFTFQAMNLVVLGVVGLILAAIYSSSRDKIQAKKWAGGLMIAFGLISFWFFSHMNGNLIEHRILLMELIVSIGVLVITFFLWNKPAQAKKTVPKQKEVDTSPKSDEVLPEDEIY